MRHLDRLVLAVTVIVVGSLLGLGTALAATVNGTNGDDTFQGTNADDTLDARNGADTVSGLDGRDLMYGGGGDDTLWGGSSSMTTGDDQDRILGEDGDDWVSGGSNLDEVYGGAGDDILVDYPLAEASRDSFFGGDGNDVIEAANEPASKDLINCGAGTDEVSADALDVVNADCESVNADAEQTDDGSGDLPVEQGDPGAEFPSDNEITTMATHGQYDIHSQWKYKYLNGDRGYIPLRYGRHTGSGSGFGYRHIKAQRGWGINIRYNMYWALRDGKLESTNGTQRKRSTIGINGCKWFVVYDVRIPSGRDQEFGIVTFYDDYTNPNCPRYQG